MKKLLSLWLASASFLSLYQTANASAFQSFDQDAGALGNHYAGNGAVADSAATEYTNPAGMVYLDKVAISTGATLLMPQIDFDGTITDPNQTHPVHDAQGGTFSAIPNFHLVIPLMRGKLAAGFGLTSPFALKTDWSLEDYASYVATSTAIQTYNLSPSLAYAITPRFSVGAGFDAEYFSLTWDQFSRHVPFEGHFLKEVNHAHSWGYGYNLGALYQVDDRNRIGLTYRSSIFQKAQGKSKIYLDQFMVPNYYETVLKTRFKLPASTQLSGYHQINPAWALLASINFTQWSSMKEVTLEGVVDRQGNPQDITLPTHFHDAFGVDFGANYQVIPRGMLRFGLGYDQSPVNDDNRSLRFTDTDAMAASTGFHYEMLKDLSLDFSYAHVFFAKGSIKNSIPSGESPQPILEEGTVHASSDILGMQLNWKFL